jgi:hypothetical protein
MSIRLLFSTDATETLVEAIDTTTARRFFLLTSIEWVALAAYVDVHIFAVGRTDVHGVTARTRDFDVVVLRMDIRFHINLEVFSAPPPSQKSGLRPAC